MNKAMANPKEAITTVVTAPIDSNPAAALVCCVDEPVLVEVADGVAVLLIVELAAVVPLAPVIGFKVGTGGPLRLRCAGRLG